MRGIVVRFSEANTRRPFDLIQKLSDRYRSALRVDLRIDADCAELGHPHR